MRVTRRRDTPEPFKAPNAIKWYYEGHYDEVSVVCKHCGKEIVHSWTMQYQINWIGDEIKHHMRTVHNIIL